MNHTELMNNDENDIIHDYRSIMNKNYFGYFFMSSFAFLIPPLCSIYMNNLDHFVLQLCVFITTFLRWGWRSNYWFMILDHTYVKVLFLFYCWLATQSYNKDNEIYVLLITGILLSIFVFFVLGVIAFKYENDLNVPLHMIVHVYSAFGFAISNFIFKSYLKFQ